MVVDYDGVFLRLLCLDLYVDSVVQLYQIVSAVKIMCYNLYYCVLRVIECESHSAGFVYLYKHLSG